ncbi:zinc finger, C3HC4 type (RING finger) protein (macronuclear) [Tetrahymena thermophila SB210]|uniref:Zinc finger, C3HC4 type (RING finger) protein n=1 Tax=Tetrahymena thermophila (strain SB210) TaxID=312017 RepID=I7LZX4_TETTS|nr:zinc finger, C3HC4 type (RING finger) protein [Tetrahymena thermophila SB210]EAR85086.3 zinc finger, C3HC4 type (RING finger) protein [Tetrahymena thermophila SB210]|eukprot:XP_001032749.3 zinc finger, C3HC4 type (RING finger) protein [Tetrahymena thermophila SB210]
MSNPKQVITIKRGSTPSSNQKPSPQINMSRKIVDANPSSQIKKITTNTRTNTIDEQFKQIAKQGNPHTEKPFIQQVPTSNGAIFENQINKMPIMNQINTQHTQNSPLFLTKQQSNSANYQPFGVSEYDKMMGNYGFPQAQYTKKQELRKEDIVSTDVYKELLSKYESIADKYQELKNTYQELQESHSEQIKKLRLDNHKFLQENILLKRKNQELVKQNKQLKEQIVVAQNEERKDNHEQLLEMMYAIRLHQQEEQMLQMAIQQSAEEFQNDPNFVNVDNMTYEEMLELEEKNGKVSRGLPQEIIQQIPSVNFNSRLKIISEKCTICISEFEYGEKLKQLPCKHIYHPECVDNWLKQEKKCPVCKGEINYN